MADDKEILIAIKVDNTEAQKRIDEQTESIIDLKKANDTLRKANKKTKEGEKLTADQRRRNTEAIARNSLKISEATKVRRNAIKSQQSEKGSLTNLRNTLSTLTATRNKDLIVGTEAFETANKEIKELTTTIKEAEQGGDDFRRSVGKYPGSFKEAAASMGVFGQSTDGATGSFDALGKVIKLNPIGIIVSLLIALVSAFGQTEEGAKKLKIAMSILGSIFKDFVSLLANGGEIIVDFFENPLESIKSFGDSIQNFVQRRVEELLTGLGQLGSAISKLFSGDFTGALEDAKKGALNLTTSLVPVAGVLKDLVPVVKEYTEKVIENAEETVKLTQVNYALERSMLAIQKQVVKLQGQEAVLAKRSEDATLSFKEQEEAQKELVKVQAERFDLQQSLLKKEESAIQSELKLAKSRNEQTLEIQQRLTEKQKELITNRNEQKLEEANNIQITAQRNQDIWEQELDFIIDVGEKRRTRFEEIATDESNSLAKRTEGLNAYDANLKQFLQSQKESFVEEGLSEEEFDRLLGIQDPAKLAEAITAQSTLSEVEKNRLREVFIEFENAEIEKANLEKKFSEISENLKDKSLDNEKKRISTEKKLKQDAAKNSLNVISQVLNKASSIAGENFEIQKALSIGQAIINTAQGVTQAFAQGGPLGFATGAAVAAAGAVQVSKIISTTPDSSGGGGVAAITGNAPTTQTQIDTSAADTAQSDNEALEAAISRIGLSVSVSEINEAQVLVAEAESGSSI